MANVRLILSIASAVLAVVGSIINTGESVGNLSTTIKEAQGSKKSKEE